MYRQIAKAVAKFTHSLSKAGTQKCIWNVTLQHIQKEAAAYTVHIRCLVNCEFNLFNWERERKYHEYNISLQRDGEGWGGEQADPP